MCASLRCRQRSRSRLRRRGQHDKKGVGSRHPSRLREDKFGTLRTARRNPANAISGVPHSSRANCRSLMDAQKERKARFHPCDTELECNRCDQGKMLWMRIRSSAGNPLSLSLWPGGSRNFLGRSLLLGFVVASNARFLLARGVAAWQSLRDPDRVSAGMRSPADADSMRYATARSAQYGLIADACPRV